MKALYGLKEKLMKELHEIAGKGELSAGDLEVIHKLTDTVKNIDKICMLEEQSGYSRGGWEAQGSYGGGSYGGGSFRSYDGGTGGSYDSGGTSYAGRGMSRGSYSDGYSGHDMTRGVDGSKERIMREMQGLMQVAEGDQRRILNKFMDELRNS